MITNHHGKEKLHCNHCSLHMPCSHDENVLCLIKTYFSSDADDAKKDSHKSLTDMALLFYCFFFLNIPSEKSKYCRQDAIFILTNGGSHHYAQALGAHHLQHNVWNHFTDFPPLKAVEQCFTKKRKKTTIIIVWLMSTYQTIVFLRSWFMCHALIIFMPYSR